MKKTIFDVLKQGIIVADDGHSLLVTHSGSSTFNVWELDEEGYWANTGSFTDQTAYKNFDRARAIGQNYIEENCGYWTD